MFQKTGQTEGDAKESKGLRHTFKKVAKWGFRLTVYPALTIATLALAAVSYPEQTLNVINKLFRSSMLHDLNGMKEQNQQAYVDIMQQNRLTFIGDTNHSDSGVRDYFFGPENTQNIIDAGVKHVLIEYPDNLQHFADRLANGIINREEFIEWISDSVSPLWWTEEEVQYYHALMADMILELHEHGIRFHFVDPGLNRIMGSVEQQFLFEMADELITYMEEENPDVQHMSSAELMAFTFKFFSTRVVFDPDFRDKMLQTYDWLINTRLGTDNIKIADNIREIIGDEKSVILYGAAHILRDNDLNELLGPENSAIINLYGHRDTYADFLMGTVHKHLLTQSPDYLHIAQDKTLYQPKPGKTPKPQNPETPITIDFPIS